MIHSFVSGAIMFGCFVAGAFFFKFWHKTRDALFWMFGAAFVLLAIERMVITLTGVAGEEHSLVYLIRLAAFLMILVAIANKNRQDRK